MAVTQPQQQKYTCGRAGGRLRVLYLVYWGAAEPLGQSLVLPAVNRLAALGVELTLVTFEKPADLKQKQEMSRIREALNEKGVNWMPLVYHKRPKVPATVFDIAHGCARMILSRLKTRVDIIHARTFIGGMMGLVLAPALRAKLVYHNEGFYPDEQVDGGVWKAGSTPHRIAKRLEQRMYARADAVIALSNKAKNEIEKIPEVEHKQTPVILAPSCVDLNHFRLDLAESLDAEGALRFVYIGSVGGRYSLDKVGRFVAVASQEFNRVNLRILTNSDFGLVKSMLNAGNLPESLWSAGSVPHQAIPDELSRRHVGLHFLPQGLSDHGGSPTKIGEYWAAGLPVVITPGAGDTDDIIRRERVGIVVHEHSDSAYRRAAAELRSLLTDPDTPLRCRRAAETHYSLEAACKRQLELYNGIQFGATQSTGCTGIS